MVQLICEPRKDASAPCYFAWTPINVKMRFHLLFPLFFVTTCRSLEQFSRTKKSRARRNSWHYRSAKSPSFTWARVQFQHRLKCIVEIGQDFIDILQRRNKKFKVSRGLSFNLPVIDEKLPLPKSILPEKNRNVICFLEKKFWNFIIIAFMKKSKRDYPMGVYLIYIYVRLSFFLLPLSSIILLS